MIDWWKLVDAFKPTSLWTYLDLGVHCRLLRIVLLILVGVHADVVECKLLLDAVLEQLPLLQGETISLGDDGNHVDSLAQLLEHNNVDWLQCVSSWCDEVQAAVDAGILDVSLTLSSQLLSQICAVLVLNVLDDRIPAAVIVDEIAIARSIDNVQAQAHAVLLNDMCDRVDFGGLTNWLVRCETTLAVDEV